MAKHRAHRRRGPLRALMGIVAVSSLVGGAAFMAIGESDDTAPVKPAVRSLAHSTEVANVEPVVQSKPEPVAAPAPTPAPPPNSGTGRRIVFSQSEQRVWLIGADTKVARTYLVSGSKHDNLKPGNYSVQAKYRHATAYDASGSMEYFVRFATGFSEPIGFHTVPRDNQGRLEQSKSQLGQRLSAGCVRQWKNDAIALWEFAPVGTPVVVTP